MRVVVDASIHVRLVTSALNTCTLTLNYISKRLVQQLMLPGVKKGFATTGAGAWKS